MVYYVCSKRLHMYYVRDVEENCRVFACCGDHHYFLSSEKGSHSPKKLKHEGKETAPLAS